MKIKTLSIILCLSASFLFAQDKIFTMEQAVLGSRSSLRVKNLGGLQFLPNSSQVSFSESKDGQEFLWLFNEKTSEKKVLIGSDEFKSLLNTKSLRGNFRFSLGKWKSENEINIPVDDKIITLNPFTKSISTVEVNYGYDRENADRCEANGLTAYTE
ncbi:MAG: hypothetical protein ACK452_13940, partial [Bacteroidota bacterium]